MVTIFLARFWDEMQPLDPALMPDYCHRCHVSVARRAGLLTDGPCYVLCPECYARLPAVDDTAAGRMWPPRRAWRRLRAALYVAGYLAAVAGITWLLAHA